MDIRQLTLPGFVHVRAYLRVRYGKQEHVRSHLRSYPTH